MLELLAGPFPLLHEGAARTFNSWIGYHDSVGFVGTILVDGTHPRGAVVALDGTIYPRNTEQLQGRIGFNFKTGGLCVMDNQESNDDFYEKMDLHMLRGQGPFVEDAVLSTGYSVFRDRYLRGKNGELLRYDPTALPTKEVEEFDFAAGPGVNVGSCDFSPGPRENLCYVAWTSGRIYLYNHVDKALADPVVRRIDPCLAAFYSPHLGVFVSVHDEAGAHVIRIWADEYKPESVAAPSALDSVFPGAVFRARTRVLGGYNEPCANLNVAWSATVGTVLDPVTETDADGYAATRVMLATNEAAASVDVTATLKF